MTITMHKNVALMVLMALLLVPLGWYTYNENTKNEWLAQGADYDHITLVTPPSDMYPELPSVCRQRDVHIFTAYDDKGKPMATRCIMSLWQLLYYWDGGLDVTPAVNLKWNG